MLFMTPKEKAQQLVKKFRIHQPVWEFEEDAKQCAIIAVDEILEDDMYDMSEKLFNIRIEYLIEVRKEIEKL